MSPRRLGSSGWTTLAALRDGALFLLIVGASFAALKQPFWEFLQRPFEYFAEVLPFTVPALLKVWTFWTVAAVIVGGLLLRRDRDLGLIDATIAGFLSVWIFSWIGGNALGPIGLLRSWTIWGLLAVGGVALWRSPPAVARVPLSPGLKLTAFAFAWIAPVLLLVQIGCPLPPFMDVLATPAGAQRIITFGRYLPYDNEPYPYFGGTSQLPGLEVFYATMGLGSGTYLATLAETAAIVPMAGLLILTTYRFGRSIAGDVAGGMATLFLFGTILFRTLPYMHGRTVSFVLVGAALAFFYEERRTTTRLVLAGLLFGTAIGTHAIIGALGMATVAATVLVWLLTGYIRSALAGVALLAGASLIAAPEFGVGLRIVLPYPVLPLFQLLGVALVGFGARSLAARTEGDRVKWLLWPLTLTVIYAILWHPPSVMINHHHVRFPLVVYGAGVGLVLMLWDDVAAYFRRRAPSADAPRIAIGPLVLAMIVGMVVESGSQRLRALSKDPEFQFSVGDLFWKVDYWYPWVLALLTGYVAWWVWRRLSPSLAVLLAAAALFYPWRDYFDPSATPTSLPDANYSQHSVVEGWVYQLLTAKGGYWGATGHRRWAQTPAEMALVDVLREEIAAGRITFDTRVVTIESEYVFLYKDHLLYFVYTGINADPYVNVGTLDWDRSSRMRPIEDVHARLAERPAYVAIRGNVTRLKPEELAGYTEIFNRDGVRLLRDDSPR